MLDTILYIDPLSTKCQAIKIAERSAKQSVESHSIFWHFTREECINPLPPERTFWILECSEELDQYFQCGKIVARGKMDVS